MPSLFILPPMKYLVLCGILASSFPVGALTIDLRYDLDSGGFFNQPGAKAALRAAADFYENIIGDHLEAIDRTKFPAGATWTPTYAHPVTGIATAVPGQANMIVPADTIIVFLGAANLGAATAKGGPGGVTGLSAEAANSGFPWANRVNNRGEAGAIQLKLVGGIPTYTTNPTDFAPWGGVLFFNSAMANWNFSTTSATATSGPDALSVALHELGHVLGIGAFVSQNSWTPLAVTGAFAGTRAQQSFGLKVQTDGTHLFPFAATSPIFGAFGRVHGTQDSPLMVTSLSSANRFFPPSDLDLAILQDIGWELSLPQPAVRLTMTPAPQLRIPSNSGFIYQIERSTGLKGWTDVLPVPMTGNGTRLTWVDPSPAPSAFYRVKRSPAPGPVSAMAAATASLPVSADSTPLFPPGLLPGNCECVGH